MIIPSPQTVQTLKDTMRAVASMEMQVDELGGTVVPREIILNHKLIPVHLIQDPLIKKEAYRHNSFVDMYFFGKTVLGKNRLQGGVNFRSSLHYQMCLSVMKDGLKEVIEIPRDHFKSTIYSEIFPIWKALPFSKREEDLFSSLGYSDLFIEWMKRAHNQDIRILLVSETITNAIKLGVKISNHYENNDTFRTIFPEILPTAQSTWTKDSLHQSRTSQGKSHGEGTFDFIGVGAALQSRHYDLAIEDDLVGKNALKSDIEMQSTIEYHQLLVGAMDSNPNNPGKDFDEIVVGNRWSHKDLNSHIRENEPYFGHTTHSALGGCCSLHPVGIPIFPESFSVEKLLRWKRRLGSYYFSCQFLNFPIDPSKAKFNMSDFRFYHFEQTIGAMTSPQWGKKSTDLSLVTEQKRTVIRHNVVEGDVEKDVYPRYLDRFMVVDPNHGGSHDSLGNGRCRHAIMVSGVQQDPRRVYILDTWAEACPIEDFIKNIFKYAIKWKLNKIHVESVGAQKYLIYHLNFYIQQEKYNYPELANLQIVELKTPQTANAKFERIDATIPAVERHEIWLNVTTSENFRDEASSYGQKRGLVDLLDVFGYSMKLWNFDTVSETEIGEFLAKRLSQYKRSVARIA